MLARCIDSVAAQTVKCNHLMVADGVYPFHPPRTRHISLDRNHDDYGNTPRAIGALLGVAERYDGIAFLDADNWYEPDHIETCLAVSAGADAVIAQRFFRHVETGEILKLPEEHDHVDTNCWLFLPGAFRLLPRWVFFPKEAALIGDRLFWQAIKGRLRLGHTEKQTVNYTCTYSVFYEALGLKVPDGVKPTQHFECEEQSFSSAALNTKGESS